jgi:hypothetical protein
VDTGKQKIKWHVENQNQNQEEAEDQELKVLL